MKSITENSHIMNRRRLRNILILAGIVIVLAAVPQLVSEYITYVAVLAMLYAILAGRDRKSTRLNSSHYS